MQRNSTQSYFLTVPAGAQSRRDVFFSPTLGTVTVDDSAPVKPGTGDSATVTGQVAGAGGVRMGKVTP
ncbi:hypothetical protein AB0L75_41680 [Streptomyces sp. NPDC052101]|uniref:hypothetical protein n=1 Tax=Streptomyces sp. NPDC052101 TaxID=3155763 RepID=UPI00341224A0